MPMKQCLLFILFFAHTSFARESFPIFILAGQSNAMGAAVLADLPYLPFASEPYTEVINNRYIYNFTSDPGQGAFVPFELGVNTMPHWENGISYWPGFGSEAGFMRNLSDIIYEDEKFALFKYGLGGTSILEHWYGEQNLASLMQSHLSAMIEKVPVLFPGHFADIKAMFWMQGESDAGKTKSKVYDEYLKRLILELRATANQDFPVFPGQIRRNGRNLIQPKQYEVARTLEDVRLVGTQHLTLQEDGVHFDALGLINLGEAFFNAYYDWLNSSNIQLPTGETLALTAFPNPVSLQRDKLLTISIKSAQTCTQGHMLIASPTGVSWQVPLFHQGGVPSVTNMMGAEQGEKLYQLNLSYLPSATQFLAISVELRDCVGRPSEVFRQAFKVVVTP